MKPHADPLPATGDASMQSAYQWLRDTSRTFALSIELLPGPVRDAITLAYLLLRVSDFLEDNDEMAAARKAELLRLWDQVLAEAEPVTRLTEQVAGVATDEADAYVTTRADVLLHQLHAQPAPVQEIIVRYVRETTRGMAHWQLAGPLVPDESGMDDYMHYVAGVVGYLITEVFAWYSPHVRERMAELMPLSREYGLALQTVNVIRGMRKDYERGWVFVPRTFYEPQGLTHHDLFDPTHSEAALRVVEQLSTKAETHLRHGLTYIQAFPRHQHRIRLACMWPLLFAARTLAVSRHNRAVLDAEAKIGRPIVERIMRESTLFGWSNHWLRWYYRQLSEPLLP